MKKNTIWLLVVLFLAGAYSTTALPEDWPTYMRDAQRSGITPMTLEMPLRLEWKLTPNQPPQPAWPEPAKQDYWNQVRELSPVVVYDRAYHVVSAGDAVYYGSSADDQVYCLDAATGALRWRFFTDGPVRLAPTVADGRVYFSSDDGYAYCVRADTGALVWKYSPADHDRRLPGNSRAISYAPARTGVLVDDGAAYFFTGLFPPQQVYKCALDAVTGEVITSGLAKDISPQGYLLASSTRLFTPTGRTAPVMFERETLANLGAMQGPGGAYALLVEDAVVSGPGVRAVNQLHYTGQDTRERIATFPGVRMLVHEGIAYLQSPGEVSALERQRYLDSSVAINQRNDGLDGLRRQLRDLDRDNRETRRSVEAEITKLSDEITALETEQESCYRWKRPAEDPYAMILVGDTLFLGGQDRVYALRKTDGEKIWQQDVEGRVYGLAAANGRLYASSSLGHIYCFSAREDAPGRTVTVARADAPYPADERSAHYVNTARHILEESGITKGYCLALGAGEGRLAYELARNSDLHVIGLEQDAEKVDAARAFLADTGLYGTRIVMHHLGDSQLPFTTYMANLIVSGGDPEQGTLSWDVTDIYRALRPYGGRAYLQQTAREQLRRYATNDGDGFHDSGDWLVFERGAVPGAGEWTQLYADASHTAYSGDELRGPVTAQWFGDPGPREMVDRHHRPMSALFQKGRLFITANNKVVTVDGYNGFPLWELDVPDSRRIGSMKDSGHQLLSDDRLYIARQDECWVVDVASGNRERVMKAPQPDDAPRDWGYLNSVGALLVGSGQAQGASFDTMSKAMVSVLEGDYRPVIMSEYLFAVDRATGDTKWLYQNGRVLNAMITVDEGRVYLMESRNAVALDNTNGRIRIDEFLGEDAFLVALDAASGAVAWERAVSLPFEHIAYLNGRDGLLIASGSYNEGDRLYYDLVAFDMASGEDRWQTKFPGLNIRGTDLSPLEGSHGEQWQHPVLATNTIYARPYAFCLETGEQKDYIAYRGGHGCGGLTGSTHYLFGRGGVPRMYPTDVDTTEGIPLTEVNRPGCWLNIIPAGGILMVPESSSGCTCAYPLQTSIALLPEALAGGQPRTH